MSGFFFFFPLLLFPFFSFSKGVSPFLGGAFRMGMRIVVGLKERVELCLRQGGRDGSRLGRKLFVSHGVGKGWYWLPFYGRGVFLMSGERERSNPTRWRHLHLPPTESAESHRASSPTSPTRSTSSSPSPSSPPPCRGNPMSRTSSTAVSRSGGQQKVCASKCALPPQLFTGIYMTDPENQKIAISSGRNGASAI